MIKTKSTKRALLMSALALVMCLSMLVGTTFAWFTDSVTSSGNIIKSGKLEIAMNWKDATADGDQQTYVDASLEPIFNYSLWEPGYIEAKNIEIANMGNLALKYQLNIVANGTVSKLADVIDVYYADGEHTLASRDMTELTYIGTLSAVLADMPDNAKGELLKDETDYVTIALKMQESAGNEYRDLAIGTNFSVKLLAAQFNSEEDAFGPGYDMYANYEDGSNEPNISVGTAAELKTALNNLVAGQSVTLTKDIDLTGADWEVSSPWNGANTDVVFDGAGHKITGLTTSGSVYGGLFGRIATNGNMTIKNLVLENVSITGTDVDGECAGGALIGWYESHGGVLTVENVTVNGVTATGFKYTGGLIGYSNVDNAVNITGCSVNGTALTSTFNESGNYKGHIGGLVGYYGKGTVTDCSVSNLTVSRAVASGSERIGALIGTATADTAVSSVTVTTVTVDGAAASAANVFGPNASATTVSKDNISFN